MKKVILASTLLLLCTTATASDRLWQGIAIGLIGGLVISDSRREPPTYYVDEYYVPPPRVIRECHLEHRLDRWGRIVDTIQVCYNRVVQGY